MIQILRNSWALLLGLLLLMMGNGLQGSLLGVRGAIEGFDAAEMSYVMAAYYLGFLGGSRLTPNLIRQVGHVRVFAAMGSLISAMFILYAALPHVWAWSAIRLVTGFCFSAVFVVAESWLNASATNDTRAQTLSAYMIVQMAGIVSAQGTLNLADPAGYNLFILISVLVSVSFLPILLSTGPVPIFETTKPMSLRQLFQASPLGCVGMFYLGGGFSVLFGMAAFYGTERGLTVAEISIFVAMIFLGGLVTQYPIGWLSDRMDRRVLILAITAVGAGISTVALVADQHRLVLYVSAFLIGGVMSPLYALLIAHTNDYLQTEDMAAASGGLIFINGVGAIGGPLVLGYLMAVSSPSAFFGFIGVLMVLINFYALYRMTQRAPVPIEETAGYAPILPQATPVAVEVAQECVIDQIEADRTDKEEST